MGIFSKITERHILASNLLCYLPILFSPLMAAILERSSVINFEFLLFWLLGIWASIAIAYLLLWRAKPHAFVLCGFPIVAHWVITICWRLSHSQVSASEVIFLASAIFINVNWLVVTRIRETRTGHLDETMPPPIGADYDNPRSD